MHNEYRGGTADVWYSGVRDLWIEYKWVERMPARVPLKPAVSPLQRLWLRGRYMEGRAVFVVVGSPTGGMLFRNPEQWENGLPVGDLMSKAEVAKWIQDYAGVPQ